MSVWTDVKGCIEFNSDAFNSKESDKGRKYFIPYPDKQISISNPIPCMSGDKPALRFYVYVRSLPRCIPIIEEAMSKLPCGERPCIRYSVQQDHELCYSCSGLYCMTRPYVYNRIKDMYGKDQDGAEIFSTFKSISKVIPMEFRTYSTESFSMSFNDCIRYCCGSGFMESFEKFITSLIRNDISPCKGYIEFTDDETPQYVYAVRFNDSSPFMKCLILDKDSNAIVAYKNYTIVWDSEGGSEDYEIRTNPSDNWYDLLKENYH